MLRWSVRWSVVGGVAAAWTTSVACGSSSAGAEASGPDAGQSDTGAGHDSSVDSGAQDGFGGDTGFPGDSGGDSGAAPTTAVFIQGSPSLPDVRLCWAFGGAVQHADPFPGAGEMPGSNYPGIPLGGAAAMGDATSIMGGLPTLYAIDAQNLARLDEGRSSQYTCDQLVCSSGPPCLRKNLDYWTVTIPSQPVFPHSANVIALSGCLPAALDPAASTARCGSSWTALDGNLHTDSVRLLPAVAPPGQIAVQAAQLSPSIASVFGGASTGDAGDSGGPDDAAAGDDGGGDAGASDAGSSTDAATAGAAVVSFGAQDAGDASVIAVLTGEGALQATPQLVSVGSSLAAYGSLGFAVDVPGLEGGAGHVWMSLAQAQQLVDPTQDPSVFFGAKRTYVVAVLGDPNAPHAFNAGGGYDGKGLHVLVVASAAPGVGGDP